MSHDNQDISVDTQKKDNGQDGLDLADDGSSMMRWIYDWLGTMIFAVIVVLTIMAIFLRQVTVNGPSMNDTLADSDRLLVESFMYTPKQGDIVVVVHGIKDKPDEAIIKRVIATEGQHIEIRYDEEKEEGFVFVDGKELTESYIRESTDLKRYNYVSQKMIDGRRYLVLSETVAEGRVFIMGDNRTNSLDSRNHESVGQVPVENLVGKAVFRIYPLNKFGPIE